MFVLPVVLTLIFAFVMGLLAYFNIGLEFNIPYSLLVSTLLFCAGFLIILISGLAFKNHNTTVNPAHPENTTALVTTGLYAYSRNPMYIGFLSWLIACVVWTGNMFNLFFLPLYIVLVNKLYIIPEEKTLERQFNQQYKDYKNSVRRWI